MQLSVVMPVRNVAPFVERAVSSILQQSLDDFEFIIGDDASTDGTRAILYELAGRDPRVKIIEADIQMGPAASSNWVISHASGDLIARMDGDDVAHPARLRRQVEVLQRHPEACLVGCLSEGIDQKGRRVRPRDRWLLARPGPMAPFPHGSIVFRRAAFEKAGGYRPEANFWEDLDLYRRLTDAGSLLVLPEPLYQHRASLLSTRLTSERVEVERSVDRMYRSVYGAPPQSDSGGVLPRVYVSLGSTRLWAGESPDALKRMLADAALKFDRQSLFSLVWAAWGALSPRTLRLALKIAVRLRDLAARRTVKDGRVYRWR